MATDGATTIEFNIKTPLRQLRLVATDGATTASYAAENLISYSPCRMREELLFSNPACKSVATRLRLVAIDGATRPQLVAADGATQLCLTAANGAKRDFGL